MRNLRLVALLLLALSLGACGLQWGGFNIGRIGNVEAFRTSKEDCEARRCQGSPEKRLCYCPVGSNDEPVRPQLFNPARQR